MPLVICWSPCIFCHQLPVNTEQYIRLGLSLISSKFGRCTGRRFQNCRWSETCFGQEHWDRSLDWSSQAFDIRGSSSWPQFCPQRKSCTPFYHLETKIVPEDESRFSCFEGDWGPSTYRQKRHRQVSGCKYLKSKMNYLIPLRRISGAKDMV